MAVGKTIGGRVAANTPPNAQDNNRQYKNAILFPCSPLSHYRGLELKVLTTRSSRPVNFTRVR